MIFSLALIGLLGSFGTLYHGDAQISGENSQLPSAAESSDELQIAVQKICPVSGQELGSMGEPVKVQAGEQTVFLCCQGCQTKPIDAGHWKAIQTRQAKAQSICPIMEKEVDATMEATVVQGHPIFVCCPPCIPKIQADPKTCLEKVRASYASFVQAERRAESEQWHVQAQAICPVSGNKLGSNGKPVKVEVGEGEHAFLCCQGCAGKSIDAKHWGKIQANLAKAQKICPVMEEPVDASMESVVVEGRKIFVCCPPCIAKIKADPSTYVDKLNRQIANHVKTESSEQR